MEKKKESGEVVVVVVVVMVNKETEGRRCKKASLCT
jgi:hypothetical protein